MELIDESGRIISTREVNCFSLPQFDVSGLQEGFYYVRLMNEQEEQTTPVVIVKHDR